MSQKKRGILKNPEHQQGHYSFSPVQLINVCTVAIASQPNILHPPFPEIKYLCDPGLGDTSFKQTDTCLRRHQRKVFISSVAQWNLNIVITSDLTAINLRKFLFSVFHSLSCSCQTTTFSVKNIKTNRNPHHINHLCVTRSHPCASYHYSMKWIQDKL